MFRPINSRSGQLPQANPTKVSAVDSEVVIHSTNGHLVLITHLLSLIIIQALLRAFYTMRYIDDAKGLVKGGYTFEKYSVAFTI